MKIKIFLTKYFLSNIALILLLINISCSTNKANLNQNSTTYKLNKNNVTNDDQKIIATFKYGNVKLADVKRELAKITSKEPKLKNLSFEKLSKDQQKIIIQEVVINEIAYRQAINLKLDNDEDYLEAKKLFESELLKQKLYLKIANEVKNEDNLKKSYDQLVKNLNGKKDYRISYIAFKDDSQGKKDADEISQKLQDDPKKFAEFAKKKSIDKETANKGGDLGFIVEDALPNEIISAIKKLKKNQVSKPILSAGNFIIIKFVDERKAEIISFAKVKENLAQNLIKKTLEDFNNKAVQEANLKIFE
jgi:parvulin-like peptidyl-prolyl isomerase